ncbi:MAG: hypothetical protein JWP67_2227, partial [Mucilaginibacter sp.]|nr:hypothetical protein [Mucilaginibacter sp.]
FGDWLLAIASYNCGKSNVEHAMEKAGANDFWSIRQYLPAETRGYVPAYIAISYVMNYSKRHNLSPYACTITTTTDTVSVNKFVPLSKIAQVLGVTLKDISILNPAYKQLMVNGTAAAPRKLIIPQIEKERFAALTQVLNNPDGPVPFVRSQPVYIASVHPKQVPASAIAQAVNNTATASAVAPGPARVLPAFYTTQKGDTFTDIATKYGINVDELMKLNIEFGNSKTVYLQPGLTIKITRG